MLLHNANGVWRRCQCVSGACPYGESGFAQTRTRNRKNGEGVVNEKGDFGNIPFATTGVGAYEKGDTLNNGTNPVRMSPKQRADREAYVQRTTMSALPERPKGLSENKMRQNFEERYYAADTNYFKTWEVDSRIASKEMGKAEGEKLKKSMKPVKMPESYAEQCVDRLNKREQGDREKWYSYPSDNYTALTTEELKPYLEHFGITAEELQFARDPIDAMISYTKHGTRIENVKEVELIDERKVEEFVDKNYKRKSALRANYNDEKAEQRIRNAAKKEWRENVHNEIMNYAANAKQNQRIAIEEAHRTAQLPDRELHEYLNYSNGMECRPHPLWEREFELARMTQPEKMTKTAVNKIAKKCKNAGITADDLIEYTNNHKAKREEFYYGDPAVEHHTKIWNRMNDDEMDAMIIEAATSNLG